MASGGKDSQPADDDWLDQAFRDTSVVAEVLMEIRSLCSSTFQPEKNLRWGLRLPRSRQSNREGSIKNKNRAIERRSPMTPLSFSGTGGSTSGSGGEGFEETSRDPKSKILSESGCCSQPEGSKVKVHVGDPSVSASESRRSNRRLRKKTNDELKEELNLLKSEKTKLTEELKGWQCRCDEMRETNQQLKRIKAEFTEKAKLTEVDSYITRTSTSSPDEKHDDHVLKPSTSKVILTELGSAKMTTMEKSSDREWMEPHNLHNIDPIINGNKSQFTLPDLNVPLDDHMW